MYLNIISFSNDDRSLLVQAQAQVPMTLSNSYIETLNSGLHLVNKRVTLYMIMHPLWWVRP